MEKGENNGVLLAAIAEVWGFKLGYAELTTTAGVDVYTLSSGEGIVVQERDNDPERSLLKFLHSKDQTTAGEITVLNGVDIFHSTGRYQIHYNEKRATLPWETIVMGTPGRSHGTLLEAMTSLAGVNGWN